MPKKRESQMAGTFIKRLQCTECGKIHHKPMWTEHNHWGNKDYCVCGNDKVIQLSTYLLKYQPTLEGF